MITLAVVPGFAAAVVLAACVAVVGWLLAWRVAPSARPARRWSTAVVLGAGLLYASALGLALVDGFRIDVVLLLWGAIAVALGETWKGQATEVFEEDLRATLYAMRFTGGAEWPISFAFLAGILGVAAALCARPAVDPVAVAWVQDAGGVSPPPTVVWSAWALLPTHSDALLGLGTLVQLSVAALGGTFLAVRRYALPHRAALAGIAALAVPGGGLTLIGMALWAGRTDAVQRGLGVLAIALAPDPIAAVLGVAILALVTMPARWLEGLWYLAALAGIVLCVPWTAGAGVRSAVNAGIGGLLVTVALVAGALWLGRERGRMWLGAVLAGGLLVGAGVGLDALQLHFRVRTTHGSEALLLAEVDRAPASTISGVGDDGRWLGRRLQHERVAADGTWVLAASAPDSRYEEVAESADGRLRLYRR